jgi:hypothetical protein
MWGCDMRKPLIPESWQPLERLDEEKMAQGRTRTFLPLFSTETTATSSAQSTRTKGEHND